MGSDNVELKQIYEEVIADVIKGVQAQFIKDGVEISVLEDLKQIWMEKLLKSKALARDEKELVILTNQQTTPEVAPCTNTCPIQILFVPEHVISPQNMILHIQLPLSSNLNQQPLQGILTTIQEGASTSNAPTICFNCKKLNNIQQIDGNHDSSSDTTSEVEENTGKAEVNTEPPLNSDDDLSGDDDDDFDTDNVIVCQFEKISRRHNKWKFCLKSGIMNVNGKDYLFKWFIGDAEW